MKTPAQWISSLQSKVPTKWGGSSKNPQAWTSNNTTAPASSYSPAAKIAAPWGQQAYIYDSFLAYDTIITYDGSPLPINAKIPASWSNA